MFMCVWNWVQSRPWRARVRLVDLFSHTLNGPFLLAQRATIVLFHPQRHAAMMK